TSDGAAESTRGFPYLRKAHYMFGWDWGARLPDAGIFRDVYLEFWQTARIESINVRQNHEEGKVQLSFEPEIEYCRVITPMLRIEVEAPDGTVYISSGEPVVLDNPFLWYPNGYGEQSLYTIRTQLIEDGVILDEWTRRIGLRIAKWRREKDEWGESFELNVNGLSVFAMGADYIPEDHLLPRCCPKRTRQLLEDCKRANFNMVRVWGGGYYLNDYFYDICDELGLMVWQDMMFACATYDLNEKFVDNVREEIRHQGRRLRSHPCIVLWCGNNEIEMCIVQKRWKYNARRNADIICLFEYILPQALHEMDPDANYWPSSPSSGGGYDVPNDPNRGDTHYWDVWHGGEPFTAYRSHFFRFVSEFGFQSFPCHKTIEMFTTPQDRNVFSYVMDKHQRNNKANGIIMQYMANTFLYPNSFEKAVYASQLLAMEAIRYGVEHWRRNRGRCMGTLYWQLNDCWPVASWASIDYYGRWKALHYAAARFFAPVLMSCEESGALSLKGDVNSQDREIKPGIRLNVCNETLNAITAKVLWALRDPEARVIEAGKEMVVVDALSAKYLPERFFTDADPYKSYASYCLVVDGNIMSEGTVLFIEPKYFSFSDPKLKVECNGCSLTVKAEAYAKSVEIFCEDGDCLYSDNFFDMNAGERTVHIIRGEGTKFSVRSVFDIR
ncbi:MAG: glycoside hydrolase family 2 protein, partial [Spirochaetales bacterium]|nr:glycoside hydrolase family 2 protein [Spirochaetales bacterium]